MKRGWLWIGLWVSAGCGAKPDESRPASKTAAFDQHDALKVAAVPAPQAGDENALREAADASPGTRVAGRGVFARLTETADITDDPVNEGDLLPHEVAAGDVVCEPTILLGASTVIGDLDKTIVSRYLERAMPRLRHCYENEILAQGPLAGTVSVQFSITATGTVTGARASGVDQTLSSCIAGVIGTIEFPKPRGGKDVKVSYPFVLRPASEQCKML